MKKITVKYTFEITKSISISDSDCPKHYTQDEWEKQQIENVGNDIAFSIDGSVNWYYYIKD